MAFQSIAPNYNIEARESITKGERVPGLAEAHAVQCSAQTCYVFVVVCGLNLVASLSLLCVFVSVLHS